MSLTVIDRARLEGAIVHVIKAWAMEHPEELLALRSIVGFYRKESNTKRRTERNLMHKAEIPRHLHVKFQKILHRDWLHDPELRNLVFRNFKVGLVNRTSESRK